MNSISQNCGVQNTRRRSHLIRGCPKKHTSELCDTLDKIWNKILCLKLHFRGHALKHVTRNISTKAMRTRYPTEDLSFVETTSLHLNPNVKCRHLLSCFCDTRSFARNALYSHGTLSKNGLFLKGKPRRKQTRSILSLFSLRNHN